MKYVLFLNIAGMSSDQLKAYQERVVTELKKVLDINNVAIIPIQEGDTGLQALPDGSSDVQLLNEER